MVSFSQSRAWIPGGAGSPEDALTKSVKSDSSPFWNLLKFRKLKISPEVWTKSTVDQTETPGVLKVKHI